MRDLNRRQFMTAATLSALAARIPMSPAIRAELAELIQDPDPSLARRRRYLQILRELLDPTGRARPPINARGDQTWEDWVASSGELPPDFLTMPSIPQLPDPLIMLDVGGREPVTNRRQWLRQRQLIKGKFDRWILGKMPPPPDNLRYRIQESRKEGSATVHDVLLEFGPEHRATLRLEVILPPGDGPFPVLLTNHQRRRPWVNTALRRGYMGCIYSALGRHYGLDDDSDAWMALYPEYDFGLMARRAWAAMRAVDYLVQQPFADAGKIAIGGHSRNAKQALIAAAYDERIGAVVDSRGNTGSSLPWRYCEDLYVQESIEELTGGLPGWFHPRLRFFIGREHKIPVDQNQLMALVAPRGLLISHAYQEHQGNPLGVELAYRSARTVYQLLGSEDNIGLYQQPGEHPSSAEDVERYFDFFDAVFGRASFPKQEDWIHGYDYREWMELTGSRIDPSAYPTRQPGDFMDGVTGASWADRRSRIQGRIRWALGEEPPGIPFPRRGGSAMTSEGFRGEVFAPVRPGAGYDASRFSFGDDLVGYLYRPPNRSRLLQRTPAEQAAADQAEEDGQRGTNWPVVIWLHPYAYATGFSRYVYWGPLYRRGFAVLCFDQIGFGSRNEYTVRFYDRYPGWSLLGKMVADTRAMIDEVMSRPDRYDTSRIYLQGYGLGARVALYTAALDDRVTGVSAACAVTALRKATADKGIEGIHHYSHVHGLMPRLGAFADGNEARLPIDYDEVIAAVAPRPVQIVAPTMDRHAPIDDVRETVEAARDAYRLLGSESELQLDTPEDFNRFPAVWMTQCNWTLERAGLRRRRR